MIHRQREGRPSVRSLARRAASLPGAFERLEARFAMDGGGMFPMMPLVPSLPVSDTADHLAPAGPSSPTPSPRVFSGPSADLESLGGCDAAFHENSEAGALPPKPATDDQPLVVTNEETAPEADAKFEFPNIPSSPTDSPGPGWFWNGEDGA